MLLDKAAGPLRRASARLRLWQLCVAGYVLYAALLLPLLGLAPYAWPLSDDYKYGLAAHQALQRGEGLFGALGAAGAATGEFFATWQGTYAAVFLMALPPFVFGQGAYAVTPFIMLAALTGGAVAFFTAVSRRALGGRRAAGLAAALVFLCFGVQRMPSPAEGLYWYNGAIYYTFFFGAALGLGAAAIMAATAAPGPRRRLWLALAGALAVVTGGGSYISGVACLLAFLAAIVCLAAAGDKRWKPLCLPGGIHTLCLLAGVLAPGNMLRQGEYIERPGFFRAIWLAIEKALSLMAGWVDLPLLLALAALCPVVWRAVAGCRFSFRLPLLATAGSAAFFAACLFAPIYATGNLGGLRLYNAAYWLLLVVLLFNLMYWTGWARRKAEKAPGGMAALVDGFLRRNALPMALALALAFGVFTWAGGTWRGLASVTAYETLAGGHAAEFDGQMRARQALLEDPELEVVELPPLTARPQLLFITDLTGDPEEWINQVTAAYYGKRAVLVVEP